jgi:riboflavin synthase
MFTGLVEEVGRMVCLEGTSRPSIPPSRLSFLLSIEAPKIAAVSQIGDSIAVNGCCLSIVKIVGSKIDFNLLQETLRCTNFGNLRPGSPVNCELSLTAHGRLGGHFVQGHVDSTAPVVSADSSGNDFRLEIEIPSGFARYLICKGSVAVNGVSLTVAQLQERSFVVWIIPQTLERTNLGVLRADDRVNLEFDLLAKYIERMRVVD